MYKDKPSKNSNKATAISDTIKDIMAKNAAPDPVSSQLEVKIDENSSVTNEDNIMDADKENTENFNTNQDETDNDSEFKNESSINNTVS